MSPKNEDIAVNVCKRKQLTNTRASGSDDALRLIPPRTAGTGIQPYCYRTAALLRTTSTDRGSRVIKGSREPAQRIPCPWKEISFIPRRVNIRWFQVQVIQLQTLRLDIHQPGTNRTDIIFKTGKSHWYLIRVLNKAVKLHTQGFQNSSLAAAAAHHLSDLVYLIRKRIPTFLHDFYQSRNSIFQVIIRIAVRAGTGNHDNFSVQIIDLIDTVIDIAQRICKFTHSTHGLNFMDPLGQIYFVGFSVFIWKCSCLPFIIISEFHLSKFRKRQLSIYIKCPAGE